MVHKSEMEATSSLQRRKTDVGLSPFDICHAGVVLRALLSLLVVLGLGSLFLSNGFLDTLLIFSLSAAVSLPGVLLWLISVCALSTFLQRLSLAGQWVALVFGGALAGWVVSLLSAWLLDFWGMTQIAGCVLTGAVLAAIMHYWMRSRMRLRGPADIRARFTELQTRIRPHFLFNTLNTAIALVRLNPSQAESVLEDLAELFRVALVQSDSAVTLEEELSLARRYLAIEQIRFNQRLTVNWDLDPGAKSALLPSLLIQPLVENAVRHGVEPSTTGGTVWVQSRLQGGVVWVSVINTLPASPGAAGHGIALNNVKERLDLMHDVASSFQTIHDKDRFEVRFSLPLTT